MCFCKIDYMGIVNSIESAFSNDLGVVFERSTLSNNILEIARNMAHEYEII